MKLLPLRRIPATFYFCDYPHNHKYLESQDKENSPSDQLLHLKAQDTALLISQPVSGKTVLHHLVTGCYQTVMNLWRFVWARFTNDQLACVALTFLANFITFEVVLVCVKEPIINTTLLHTLRPGLAIISPHCFHLNEKVMIFKSMSALKLRCSIRQDRRRFVKNTGALKSAACNCLPEIELYHTT